MDNKIEKTSADYVLTFDGIIEKTGMCIRSLLGRWLPLEVIFKTKGNFNLEGKAKESKTKTAYNDFLSKRNLFQGKAQIQQIVHVTNPRFQQSKLS
jgi:thiol:disulfide interchange protein DsbD